MVYKTLASDFYYENSGITSLSYYITADSGTIYTGRAFNPKGIKINVRKAIDDWLVNDMPDFREYDGVMVLHEDAYKVFGLYDMDGTLLEEYGVFLTNENIGIGDLTYRGIDGKADPRQKIFVGVMSEEPVEIDVDEDIKNPEIVFDSPFIFDWMSGVTTICYTANTDFTLSSYDGGWFSVTQAKADEFTGCLTFTYTTNENRTERDGTLCMDYVGAGEVVGTMCFPVVQRKYSGDMYFDLSDGYVGQAGGRVSLPYTTNYNQGEYRVVAEGGASVVSYNNGYVVLSVPPNSSEEVKTYNVKVYSTADGSLIETAVVRQETACALDYLTIEPLETGFLLIGYTAPEYVGNQIQISRDNGATWETISTTSVSPGNIINVTEGQDILLKGYNQTNWTDPEDKLGMKFQFESGYYENGVYKACARFNLKGNMMSLVYGDDFRDKFTLESGGTFSMMFHWCDNLISAEKVVLPATIISEQCYQGLFGACHNLEKAPLVLPAENLPDRCYKGMLEATAIEYAPAIMGRYYGDRCCFYMFEGCSSLVEAPEIYAETIGESSCYYMFAGCSNMVKTPSILPALVLADECYYMMFAYCTKITTAPKLPAPHLVYLCYAEMFYGCSMLNRIECLATSWREEDYPTSGWVRNVGTPTGTFVKAPSMTGWTSGNDGIPVGWTIIDAV